MPAGDEDDGGLGEGPASHVNKMRDGGETRRGGHGPGGSSEGHQDVDDLLSQVEQTVALELKKKKKKKHIPKPTGIPGERQAVRSLRRPSNAPRPIGGLEMREMREAQSEPKNMNRLGRIHRHDAVAEGTRSRDPFGFSWRHITRNAFSIQSMWRRRRAQIRTEELETEVSKHRLEAARYRRRMYAAMASLVGVVCILFVVVYVAVQTSKDTTFHAGSAVLQVKATGEPVRVNAAEWHIDASGVARMRVPSDGGVGDGGGDAGGAASGAGSGSGSGTVVAQEVVKAFVLLSELTRASIHALSSVEAVTFTTRDDGAQHIFKGFSVRQYMREDGLAAVELKGPSWPLAGQAVRITNASAELLEIVGPGPKYATRAIQYGVHTTRRLF